MGNQTVTIPSPLNPGDSLTVTVAAAPPPAGWGSRPAFLARPVSGVINLSGQSNFAISAKAFRQQVGENVVSIQLSNCHNFQILDNDFDGDTEPIFLYQCTDFELGWLRARNIVGPSARDGSHRGNLVQMDTCLRYHIHDFKVLNGDTEDIISNYKSGGVAGAPSIIENFAIENDVWSSSSGTGVILGDVSGDYIEVRNGTLLSAGQVPIQVISGVGHHVHNLDIYQAPRPGLTNPNAGITTYGGNPTVEIDHLRVNFHRNDGSASPYWFQDPALVNAHDNDWVGAALDPAAMKVVL